MRWLGWQKCAQRPGTPCRTSLRARSTARALPNDFQRALALMRVAHAQVGARLRDEGIRTFDEAVAFARKDGQMLLGDIANAQHRAGLMKEAAATFEVTSSWRFIGGFRIAAGGEDAPVVGRILPDDFEAQLSMCPVRPITSPVLDP